jgi:hypothetical protein
MLVLRDGQPADQSGADLTAHTAKTCLASAAMSASGSLAVMWFLLIHMLAAYLTWHLRQA